jgi:hypothetical protein
MSQIGNPVNGFTKVAAGVSGYVIVISMTANQIALMQMAQAQYNTSPPGVVAAGDVGIQAIMGYLNAPGNVTLAYAQTGGNLWIYLDSTAYPYGATTGIALTYLQNPTPPPSDGASAQVPIAAWELFKAYFLSIVKKSNGVRVPFDVSQNVIQQKKLLGLN